MKTASWIILAVVGVMTLLGSILFLWVWLTFRSE